MKTEIDWKGIAHCWETLIKENQKQAEILRILKWLFSEDSLDYVGNGFGIDINGNKVFLKSKKDLDSIKEWLEEKE